MKYFLDTEFIEGTQKKLFGHTKPTIELISIGIVSEDKREYYAISKDFNLKEAWNRYQIEEIRNVIGDKHKIKVYWIRENVLKSIFNDLMGLWKLTEQKANEIGYSVGYNPLLKFTYKNLKKLISMYGKSNKQIASEVVNFVNYKSEDHKTEYCLGFSNKIQPEFYGYYADYDWVVFCWLFGKMIDLPEGFPMYCRDLKQMIDERGFDSDWLKSNLPKTISEHNALADAKWNLEVFNLLQKSKDAKR